MRCAHSSEATSLRTPRLRDPWIGRAPRVVIDQVIAGQAQTVKGMDCAAGGWVSTYPLG